MRPVPSSPALLPMGEGQGMREYNKPTRLEIDKVICKFNNIYSDNSISLMDTVLSVFFNVDRVYVAHVGITSKGLSLKHVNSTRSRVDLENIDSDTSRQGIVELEEILREINFAGGRLSATIPAESVLVTQFPGSPDMKANDLRQLLQLEIQQGYPQFNYDDFTSIMVPMLSGNEQKKMMKAVIVPKQIYSAISDILKPLNRPLDKIEISQFNAHSAFLYNYPERVDDTIALLGVQSQFVDISVIVGGQMAYYELTALPGPSALAEVCETEITKILESHIDKIDAAFFFGSGLTKDQYLSVWETSMLLGFESGRLNAFRMMDSTLSQREKEYCSRTMHIFPPCIGGCIPSCHERLRLY